MRKEGDKMAEEWKIRAAGEKTLTVELPDSLKIGGEMSELEPETLARAILQWVEEQKLGSSRDVCLGIYWG
jgi:hypothetical protein